MSEVSYPLTLLYPAGANIAAPSTWLRLPTGEIEATYHDYPELFWAVTLSKWLKEWSAEAPAELHQAELIPRGNRGAAYDLV